MSGSVGELARRIRLGADATNYHRAFDPRARLAYCIIAANFVACGVAAAWMGFGFSPKLALPFGACLLLVLGGCLARRIGHGRLGGTLEMLGILYLGGLAVEMLSLPLAATDLPYTDDLLAAMDATIGINVGQLFRFFDLHQHLIPLAFASYASFDVQPFIVFPILLFTRGADRAWVALTGGLLALTISAAFFPFFPAVEAYVHFGFLPGAYSPAVHELPWVFVHPLEMLRSGEIRTISPDYFKGYISFPSFHAAAAAIFAWAGWKTPLRWFLVALNITMAFTAMSIGAHYMVDIIGGIAVACLTVPLAGAWIKRIPSPDCNREMATRHV